MRRFIFLVVMWLFIGVTAWAQTTPKYELFGGYSHLLADVNHTSFNLDGGEASAVENVNNWFGGMLDFGIQYGTRNGYKVNSEQIMYGPVFSYRKSPMFTPSAHLLLGAVRGSQGFAGISQNSTRFGAAFGGSLDFRLTNRVSFRVIQGDYLITNFMGTHQDSIRLSTGLVFTFGGKR